MSLRFSTSLATARRDTERASDTEPINSPFCSDLLLSGASTREGRAVCPSSCQHARYHPSQDAAGLKEALRPHQFDVVYDMNGREAAETKVVLDACPGIEQYIYCSSAGVYLKTDMPPHCEEDAVDPKSRHKGKLDTESFLHGSGVNYTSIRPVYIYGPLNYNPVEEASKRASPLWDLCLLNTKERDAEAEMTDFRRRDAAVLFC